MRKIIINTYKQNETYIFDDLIELRDVFCERVENNINEDLEELDGKIISIQFLLNNDKGLTCFVTLDVDKEKYNMMYEV